MLKFFRHIRRSLLNENKMGKSNSAKASAGKYFRYAIGEIILVVIGILIALQINNWNENRNTEKAKAQSLLNLKKEFESNLGFLQRQEDSIDKTNKNLIKLINFSVSTNPVKNSDSLMYYVDNMFYFY